MQDRQDLPQVMHSRLLSRVTDTGFVCPECGADAIVATWAATHGERRGREILTSIRICSANAAHPEPRPDPDRLNVAPPPEPGGRPGSASDGRLTPDGVHPGGLTTRAHSQLYADATELILNRLDAFRLGDLDRVGQIDAAARKDPVFQAALWSCAFGVADRLLDRLVALDADAAAAQMASFREEVAAMRHGH
jgi:hypothetical protein